MTGSWTMPTLLSAQVFWGRVKEGTGPTEPGHQLLNPPPSAERWMWRINTWISSQISGQYSKASLTSFTDGPQSYLTLLYGESGASAPNHPYLLELIQNSYSVNKGSNDHLHYKPPVENYLTTNSLSVSYATPLWSISSYKHQIQWPRLITCLLIISQSPSLRTPKTLSLRIYRNQRLD